MPKPDNRSEGRSNVFLTATLNVGGTAIPVRIRNIATRGVLVEAPALPPVGTRITLTRGQLRAAGELTWDGAGQAGISFHQPIQGESGVHVATQTYLRDLGQEDWPCRTAACRSSRLGDPQHGPGAEPVARPRETFVSPRTQRRTRQGLRAARVHARDFDRVWRNFGGARHSRPGTACASDGQDLLTSVLQAVWRAACLLRDFC